jgi:(p)ppGpp synthase/HD superfamily hydrolase
VIVFYEALKFACIKHHGQLRKSKDGAQIPYVTHVIDVAGRLEAAEAPRVAVITGLLHDTVEDTNTTFFEISTKFGSEVAQLVSHLTLPEHAKMDFNAKREFQLSKMRTMPIWGVCVKIADKSSNLQSLISQPPAWGRNAIRGFVEDAKLVVDAGYERFKGVHAPDKLYAEFLLVYEGVRAVYPWLQWPVDVTKST